MEESQRPATMQQQQQAPKSPPLAFQTTSNDALWAPSSNGSKMPSQTSPSHGQAFDMHVSESELEMQVQIDKQAEALRLQHQAFVAERESWELEKDRLFRRIAALELLLKGTTSSQSPAHSPIVSPSTRNLCSPPSVNATSPLAPSRLASIAEVETTEAVDENRGPLPALMRASAPKHIDLASLPPTDVFDDIDTNDGASSDMVDEVPRSPPQSRARLSPLPLRNRHLAGHTPLRGSITGPLSPALSTFSERLDTPTRSNTTLNETLTANSSGDRPLKGPLMMPELPNQPGDENFTISMLEAKLQDLVEHPEESEPVVLKSCSPAAKDDQPESETDQKAKDHGDTSTKQPVPGDSKLTSPQLAQKGDDAMDGGIKLRKKPSSNFGAPLGQLHPMWKH